VGDVVIFEDMRQFVQNTTVPFCEVIVVCCTLWPYPLDFSPCGFYLRAKMIVILSYLHTPSNIAQCCWQLTSWPIHF